MDGYWLTKNGWICVEFFLICIPRIYSQYFEYLYSHSFQPIAYHRVHPLLPLLHTLQLDTNAPLPSTTESTNGASVGITGDLALWVTDLCICPPWIFRYLLFISVFISVGLSVHLYPRLCKKWSSGSLWDFQWRSWMTQWTTDFKNFWEHSE